jgi:hypothetical protein
MTPQEQIKFLDEEAEWWFKRAARLQAEANESRDFGWKMHRESMQIVEPQRAEVERA